MRRISLAVLAVIMGAALYAAPLSEGAKDNLQGWVDATSQTIVNMNANIQNFPNNHRLKELSVELKKHACLVQRQCWKMLAADDDQEVEQLNRLICEYHYWGSLYEQETSQP